MRCLKLIILQNFFRSCMSSIWECSKRIEYYHRPDDDTPYPSAGHLMKRLPPFLKDYLPTDFDIAAPAPDRERFEEEFTYRAAKSDIEWPKTMTNRRVQCYSIKKLPRLRKVSNMTDEEYMAS